VSGSASCRSSRISTQPPDRPHAASSRSTASARTSGGSPSAGDPAPFTWPAGRAPVPPASRHSTGPNSFRGGQPELLRNPAWFNQAAKHLDPAPAYSKAGLGSLTRGPIVTSSSKRGSPGMLVAWNSSITSSRALRKRPACSGDMAEVE
jgi:hypothetical protein